MRCLECGAEFDEMNESQPVCPGCGSPPGMGRDDAEIGALLDEAAVFAAAPAETGEPDLGLELDEPTCPKDSGCFSFRLSASCEVSSECSRPLPHARRPHRHPSCPNGFSNYSRTVRRS